MGKETNDLWLCPSGCPKTKFKLKEFANRDGLACVHRRVVIALNAVRKDLCDRYNVEVEVIITSATRTESDNERLAGTLGWADEGGAVARNSKHLTRYGGIAVDLTARVKGTKSHVPQRILGQLCRRHFDWVKDDYPDGHVHADMRTTGI